MPVRPAFVLSVIDELTDAGAVLPNLAAVEFDPKETVQFPLPILKAYARPIALAWNPRLTEVRPIVERAIQVVQQELVKDGADKAT